MKPRDLNPLERSRKELSLQKLLDILIGIYPEDMAIEIFTELTGIKVKENVADANE